MRKGFNGLVRSVGISWSATRPSGHVFLFANAQRDRLKLFCFRWFGFMGLREVAGFTLHLFRLDKNVLILSLL